MSADQQPVKISDLFELQIAGSPRLSPSGEEVLYTKTRQDRAKNRSFTNLWIASLTGEEEPRKLTHGNQKDLLPRWSPDEEHIAFVSDRGEAEDQQLYLLPLDGGDPFPAGLLVGEFTALDWAPDGQHLVASVRRLTEQERRDKRKQEGKELEPQPEYREITRLHYKEDGRGFLPDERYHLCVYSLDENSWSWLTEGNWDDLQPTWSPNGEWIAFIANRNEQPDYDPDDTDIWVVKPSGNDLRKLTEKRGPYMSPHWSPDGDKIAFIGHRGEPGTTYIDTLYLWTVDLDGNMTPLNPDLDRTALNLTLSDSKDFSIAGSPLLWKCTDGEESIVFPTSDEGSVVLREVSSTGGKSEVFMDEDCEIISFHGRPEHDTFVLLYSREDEPVSVYSADSTGRLNGEPLDGSSQEYASNRILQRPQEHSRKGPGGREQDFWVLVPEEPPPDTGYPMILQIHGGPHAQYGRTFFHEFQTLVSRGYVVVYGNPRGSQGYGPDFAEEIRGDWGEPAFNDLMGMVDLVIDEYDVDEERLGVAGGSYGGYMTNWIVAHTDRFQAAVTMRCVANMVSMFGSSDFGYEVGWWLDGTPWEEPGMYRQLSPLTYAPDVDTPLLIVHSEEDHRCPVSEAEQMYTYLKWQKKEVKMIRFKGESHGLSRQGRPLNREVRLKKIVEWFDRFLK